MQRTLITTLVLCLTMTAGAQKTTRQEPFTGYLFAYFEGRGDGQEQLRFALSDDAVHWRALNENIPS